MEIYYEFSAIGGREMRFLNSPGKEDSSGSSTSASAGAGTKFRLFLILKLNHDLTTFDGDYLITSTNPCLRGIQNAECWQVEHAENFKGFDATLHKLCGPEELAREVMKREHRKHWGVDAIVFRDKYGKVVDQDFRKGKSPRMTGPTVNSSRGSRSNKDQHNIVEHDNLNDAVRSLSRQTSSNKKRLEDRKSTGINDSRDDFLNLGTDNGDPQKKKLHNRKSTGIEDGGGETSGQQPPAPGRGLSGGNVLSMIGRKLSSTNLAAVLDRKSAQSKFFESIQQSSGAGGDGGGQPANTKVVPSTKHDIHAFPEANDHGYFLFDHTKRLRAGEILQTEVPEVLKKQDVLRDCKFLLHTHLPRFFIGADELARLKRTQSEERIYARMIQHSAQDFCDSVEEAKLAVRKVWRAAILHSILDSDKREAGGMGAVGAVVANAYATSKLKLSGQVKHLRIGAPALGCGARKFDCDVAAAHALAGLWDVWREARSGGAAAKTAADAEAEGGNGGNGAGGSSSSSSSSATAANKIVTLEISFLERDRFVFLVWRGMAETALRRISKAAYLRALGNKNGLCGCC
eukprot:g1237.t1